MDRITTSMGHRLLQAGLLVASVVAAWVVAAPAQAPAAKAGTCEAFTVFVNGQTFRGNQQRTNTGPINSIAVRGRYIEFDVVPSTFAVTNYLHTGGAVAATGQEHADHGPDCDFREQGAEPRRHADEPAPARARQRVGRAGAERVVPGHEDPGEGLPPGWSLPDGARARHD